VTSGNSTYGSADIRTGTYHRYYGPVGSGPVRDTPRKLRTLWPMPGGSGSYLRSLNTILGIVQSTTDTDEVLNDLVVAFPGVASFKAARSYLHVVAHLGLVDLDGPTVRVTDEGQGFLRTSDPVIVRQALLTRIAGTCELVKIIRQRPARIGLLLPKLQACGYEWTTLSQVRYRLRWLEEVGVVARRGRARPEYRLTDDFESA